MSSLCPTCNFRPRRLPGQRCNQCHVAIKRERRRELSSGAPKAKRVLAESTELKRFDRTLNAKRYLITSAQNATPVHAHFLLALQRAAKHLKAEIVAIPIRYKNPTSVWSTSQKSDDWWAPELEPYLFNVRRKLNPNLVLCGDVKIQPTAQSPLTGFEALTGAESCIIGHPRMQFRSVAAPSGRYPKILSTTGSITRRNFTDSKAGKLGAFHHHLGAILVEVDGKTFHLRQLTADRTDGSFIDLTTLYTAANAPCPAPRALGLVMGDTHAKFIDKVVESVTFGPGGLVQTLDPETLVFEDLLDAYAVNPHHFGNPFIARAKHIGMMGDVRSEVVHAIDFVCTRAKGRKAVIVASNHDDFLSRWVISSDWKANPLNAPFYLETAMAMLASSRMTAGGAEYADPFTYWVNKLKGKSDIKCLGPNESFKLGKNECGAHGHRGPNGARGTLKNLSRLGSPMISGHSHTPGIEEGHYQVGTSTPLRLEYTQGPSSWQNTSCVVYANGTRSLITIIDGKWRL